MAERYRVGDLPYDGRRIHPPYWTEIPDTWLAEVMPAHIVYGNGIVGDVVRYMAFEPEDGIRLPITFEAIGDIVVRDIRQCEDIGPMGSSAENGETVGRFGYYTKVCRERSGGAPEMPAYGEADKRAQGFAWGYVEGFEAARPTQERLG